MNKQTDPVEVRERLMVAMRVVARARTAEDDPHELTPKGYGPGRSSPMTRVALSLVLISRLKAPAAGSSPEAQEGCGVTTFVSSYGRGGFWSMMET